MKPDAYNYPNDTFRGFVQTYQGNVMTPVLCDVVRKNRLKAREDAEKMIKKLRQK